MGRMWVCPYGTHLIMSGYQSQQITSQTLIRREIKQIVSFINIVLSPGQNYICVEYKMTNNGPMMVPHGLKIQYRTHIGPIWAVCPESAHMVPFGHACWVEIRWWFVNASTQAGLLTGNFSEKDIGIINFVRRSQNFIGGILT